MIYDNIWFYEWDFFSKPYVISDITIPFGPIVIEKMIIKREEDYSIGIECISQIDDPQFFYEYLRTLQQPISFSFEIPYFNEKCVLENGYIQKTKTKRDGDLKTLFLILEISYSSITISQQEMEKNTHIVEWFLNGSNPQLVFYQPTDRNYTENFKRTRRNPLNKPLIVDASDSGEVVLDHFVFEYENCQIIVSRVPKDVESSWKNCISIEYRNSDGEYPTEDIRDSIHEIVSFLLGKQLLNIGHTEFNENEFAVSKIGFNPGFHSITRKKDSLAYLPVPLSEIKDGGIERILTLLTPRYVNIKKDYGLDKALLNLWWCEVIPLEFHIPIMHQAIEILAKDWILSPHYKGEKTYVKKEDYEKFYLNLLPTLKENFSQCKHYEKLESTIRNANNIGTNHRIMIFLNSLGLELGSEEKKAMNQRNSLMHDQKNVSIEFIDNIKYYTNVYKSFFHRVILKMLEYDGNYVDYSDNTNSIKPLNTPAGKTKI